MSIVVWFIPVVMSLCRALSSADFPEPDSPVM